MSESRTRLEAARAAVSPLDEVRAALGTLTWLPVGIVRSDASGAAAFGLVGSVVGLIGAVPVVLLGGLVPLPASILALTSVALVSGAIHLDGLADTADALLAMGTEAAERARKDPAVGPGGAVAIVLVLGLEATSLASAASAAGAVVAAGATVVAAVVSRVVVVPVTLAVRGAAVRGGGTGARFAAGLGPSGTALTMGTAVVVVALVSLAVGSPRVGLAGLVGAFVGAIASGLVVRWRGGLDGDGMGAIVELTFASVLVATAVAATV